MNIEFTLSTEELPKHGQEVAYIDLYGLQTGIRLQSGEIEYSWVDESGLETSYSEDYVPQKGEELQVSVDGTILPKFLWIDAAALLDQVSVL